MSRDDYCKTHCFQCGKEFVVLEREAKITNFCSKQCENEHDIYIQKFGLIDYVLKRREE